MTATKTEQTATLPDTRHANACNYWGEKELTDSKVLVILDDENELREAVVLRWWMARRSDGMSPVYCSIWIRGGLDCSGTGKASGCGYHKASAAAGAAFRSAGVELAQDIEGRGDSAVVEAMHAIANAIGYADNHIRTVV